MSDAMKVCRSCDRELPTGLYYKKKSAKDGLQSSCKECAKTYDQNYYQTNSDRRSSVRERARKRYHEKPEEVFRNWLWSMYRMTPERYNELRLIQGNRCAICRSEESHRSRKRLSIDHDHKCCPGVRSCGLCVRGLLCSRCNQAIGLFLDSSEAVRMALTYLEGTHAVRG